MRLTSILNNPRSYRAFTNLLPGGRSCRRRFVGEHVQATEGDRILDIGCGTGDILEHLPPCEYLGFDANADYIADASRRYGHRGTFVCAEVTRFSLADTSPFDIVLGIGILHHLDDIQAGDFFELAKNLLKPGGRLVTLDGLFWEGQSWLERFIMRRDRGQFIRTQEHYIFLAAQAFPRVQADIRGDLLKIPYTHIIMRCSV
jgi:SAM-dependent methyltransferase